MPFFGGLLDFQAFVRTKRGVEYRGKLFKGGWGSLGKKGGSGLNVSTLKTGAFQLSQSRFLFTTESDKNICTDLLEMTE